MTEFDIRNYQFLFDQVLADPLARGQLKKYMHKERNSELFDFFELCESLQHKKWPTSITITDINQAKTFVKQMYDTFIDPMSFRQINVGSDTLKRVRDAVRMFCEEADETTFDLTVVNQQDSEIFDVVLLIFRPAYLSVMNSLERDSFVRFVRSPEWKKFVKAKYRRLSDLEHIAVHKTQLKQILVTIQDEERNYISARDIEMTRNVMRDGVDSKLIDSVDYNLKYVQSMLLFSCSLKISDPALEKKCGPLVTYKRVVTYNCPARDVLTALQCGLLSDFVLGEIKFDDIELVRANNDTLEQRDNTNDVSLNSLVFKYDHLIPLVAKRRSIFCFSTVYVPKDDTYYVIIKPGPPKEATPPNVVPMRFYSRDTFEVIDNNRSRHTSVLSLSLGGKLDGNALLDYLGKKIQIATHRGIVQRTEAALVSYIDHMQRAPLRDSKRAVEIMQMNKDIGDLL